MKTRVISLNFASADNPYPIEPQRQTLLKHLTDTNWAFDKLIFKMPMRRDIQSRQYEDYYSALNGIKKTIKEEEHTRTFSGCQQKPYKNTAAKLYAEIHQAASENTGQLEFAFYTADEEFKTYLYEFFQDKKELIPSNLTLKLYDIDSPTNEALHVTGSGTIDYNYSQNQTLLLCEDFNLDTFLQSRTNHGQEFNDLLSKLEQLKIKIAESNKDELLSLIDELTLIAGRKWAIPSFSAYVLAAEELLNVMTADQNIQSLLTKASLVLRESLAAAQKITADNKWFFHFPQWQHISNNNLALITDVLKSITTVLQSPTTETIQQAQDAAEKVAAKPWGQYLAAAAVMTLGTLMILGGFAMILSIIILSAGGTLGTSLLLGAMLLPMVSVPITLIGTAALKNVCNESQQKSSFITATHFFVRTAKDDNAEEQSFEHETPSIV